MAESQAADPKPDNPQSSSASGQGPGSLLTDVANAPNAAQAQAEPKAATSEAPPWMAQLEADLKTDTSLTKFRTLSELGRSYRELEGKLGNAIIPPGENASKEDVEAYLKKLGRPDKPEDYVLDGKLPEDLKSAELEKDFRAWAHDLGLSQKQAAEMYAKYNQRIAAIYNEKHEVAKLAIETEKKNGDIVLRREWGDDYDKNRAAARRAFQHFAKDSVVAKFERTSLGNDPEIVMMFANIGLRMAEAPFITSNQLGQPVKSPEKVLYPDQN